MNKVLIVDDEPNIRRGLVHIIDWKHFNCHVVGDASDGLEGLEKIQDLKPDIIFVDINMPEMTGLEMMEKAKAIVPRSKFIILSGYRDFAYLQEAIKLGAFDYILKPSKIENISSVLKKAVLELKYQKERREEIEKLKVSFNKSLPLLREKLLYDLILQKTTIDGDIKELLDMYHLEINEFQIVLLDLNQEGHNLTFEQKHLYQFGVMNTIHELLDDTYILDEIKINTKQVALVIQSQEAINPQSLYEKIESAHELVKNCFDYSVTIAISSIGKGPTELSDKLSECHKCLDYEFYLGKDTLIIYEDLEGFYHQKTSFELEHFEKTLKKSIESGDMNNTHQNLEDLRQFIESNSINLEINELKNFYCNLIYNINQIRLSVKALGDYDTDIPGNIYSFYQMIDTCNDVFELQDLLYKISTLIVSRIHEYNQNNMNSTLQGAVDYIHNNYHNSLSLEELASAVYISPYYLSRIFKKELGKTFVDYLNEYRIGKAKELLINTDYKTYEVAELVGIGDSHYFSKLFKRYTKLTPTEFRNK